MESTFNDEVVADGMVTDSSENGEQTSPTPDSKQQSVINTSKLYK